MNGHDELNYHIHLNKRTDLGGPSLKSPIGHGVTKD